MCPGMCVKLYVCSAEIAWEGETLVEMQGERGEGAKKRKAGEGDYTCIIYQATIKKMINCTSTYIIKSTSKRTK